jgi:hypothetical protein
VEHLGRLVGVGVADVRPFEDVGAARHDVLPGSVADGPSTMMTG